MITTSPRASWWTVLTLAGLYALFFSAYTIQRHQAFLTSAFDLGNFDQTIWNTAHGRPFALTAIPGITSHLAIHFSPILLLVAPIYWLWPDVRALLILQSVALAAGAIPLFWYAARKVGRGPAVVFAAIYLLFPALHGVNLFDFHDVALAPPLLLLAWNWLDERRDLPFAVAAILAAMTKEEIGLLVAMMGLYALLVQRRAFGLAPLVLGFGWFLVTLELLIPAFNPSGQHQFLGFYDRFGGSGPEVALYLLTHPLEVLRWLAEPRRLAYLRDLLTPVLGLSLLAPHVLMIAAPSLAVNLLSTLPAMTELEGFHYPAPIVPFVVASSAAGLGWVAERVAGGSRLGGGRRREKGGRGERADGGAGLAERRARVIWVGSLAMLGATLAYHATHGQTPLALGWQWPRTTAHHRIGQEIIAGIPSDAAVSAQWRLVPHLSQREKIYEFPDVRDADVVLLDVTILDLNMHPNDVRRRVEELLAAGWGVGAARDGWLLLRRGGATAKTSEVLVGATTPPPQLPDEFYSFARLDAPPEPQFQMQANFGDTLRLLGYDLALTPDGPRLTAYWTALGPIEKPVQLWPLYLDPHDGRVLEDTRLRPLIETLWYPPERWRPGEIVRTTTIPWEFGRDYVVSMSVRAAGESGEWLEPRIVT
ncbi:MAG TPA: DUF2079 domain-containing protein, partial [Lacipirellulaceae bacterium]|nr:DUF2079 domain-containing protein [Lacipirellulaceae bacterium]